MDNDVTIVVDAKNRSAHALGEAAKGAKTVGDAAAIASRQVRDMGDKLDAAQTRARKMAQAEEQAAEKARRLAQDLALARRQLEQSGDASGALSRRIDRLAVDTRFAAIATEEYRRSANRASAEAREQARAYDRVAGNAREAARAVALLGASSRLGGGGKGGLGGGLGGISEGFLKGGLGGASAALEGALGTPVVGPALLAGGAAAAIPAASFLGGAAGGGALAGIGAGAAGAGLAGAWMDDPDKFDQMWSHSIDNVRTRWLNSSRAFGDELTGALKVADTTLKNLPVERILALSQSFVAPLAEGVGGGVTNTFAGIADALERVQPIVDNVGPKLANLGNDVGDAFRMISEGSEGGALALGDFVDAAGYVIKATGLLILGFEKSYENMRSFAVGVRDNIRSIPALGVAYDGLTSSLFGIRDSTMTAARELDNAGDAAHNTAFDWGEMAEAGAEAALETLGLNDALTKTRNTMLGMADANLAVAQGWLDLKDGLSDGAKTLDTNTQAGIDNTRVIQDQVEALERQRLQAIETGGGTVEAVNAANAAYDAQIERLRQAAYAAGYDKQQVDNLIASLGAVPKDTEAKVEVKGLQESLRQGESLRQRLDQIDGRVAVANVYVNYHSKGQSLNVPLAHGGPTGSGMSEVNDWGGAGTGELIRTPSGSTVIPAGTGRQLLRDLAAGGGRGGGRVVHEFRFTGSGALFELVMAGQRSGELQIFSEAIVD
jgi:hypothetical protein